MQLSGGQLLPPVQTLVINLPVYGIIEKKRQKETLLAQCPQPAVPRGQPVFDAKCFQLSIKTPPQYCNSEKFMLLL